MHALKLRPIHACMGRHIEARTTVAPIPDLARYCRLGWVGSNSGGRSLRGSSPLHLGSARRQATVMPVSTLRSASRVASRGNLKLSKKYLDTFFRVANDTVIARHTGDPTKIRPPELEELSFCVFFSRMVLDRFGAYLWHRQSDTFPQPFKYPSDEPPPSELFEDFNPGLTKILRGILRGEYS